MKLRSKSAIKKRIKITKTGKVKRREAARRHLRRNKRARSNFLLDVRKGDKKIVKLFSK